MREKEDYRANLELLRSQYPGKQMLTMAEACEFLRRDRRALLRDKSFPAKKVSGRYEISLAALARYIS